VRSYVEMFGLDAFVIRPFNNYGPRQNCRNYLAGVIPKTFKSILDGGRPEVHGSGKQTRDFIYVEDTCQLSVRLFDKLPPGSVVNLAANQPIMIKDLVDRICRLAGYAGEIVSCAGRPADVMEHIGDNRLAANYVDFNYT